MKRAILEKYPLADECNGRDLSAALGERPYFKFYSNWAAYLINQKPMVRDQVIQCLLTLQTTGEYVRPTNSQAFDMMEMFAPAIKKEIKCYLGAKLKNKSTADESEPMPAHPVTAPMPEPKTAEPQRPATATAPQVQPMPTPANMPPKIDVEKVPESIRNAFKNCKNFDEFMRLKNHFSGWENNKEYQQFISQFNFEDELPF